MQAASRSSAREESLLRNLAVAAGLGWSLAFVIVALVYELQLYADGAMFSYAVAVQDVWAFHWHNIANRASVFFLSLWPAETLVGLTGSPAAGIITYGFLFYVAPLIGLAGHWHCRPITRSHFFCLRVRLDRFALPVDVRIPDGNVDGACAVLAGACAGALCTPGYPRGGRPVNRDVGFGPDS